jgi:GNAT superfamily N-acetyltransferase
VPGRLLAVWAVYRTAILLSGFVVAGWVWDLALGGGWAHAIAWLIALVVVGGISALAARGSPARPEPAADRRPDRPSEPTTDEVPIRRAEVPDFEQLIEIEVAADKLFEVAGYGVTPGPATVEELAEAELLLVAGQPPVGYARVEVVDGRAHLEGLSVRPRAMRRGTGSALVLAACEWAVDNGFTEMTLTTFAEVPWNGPFYAGLGFVELELPSAGLLALREAERKMGLDAMGRRIVMVRNLVSETVSVME